MKQRIKVSTWISVMFLASGCAKINPDFDDVSLTEGGTLDSSASNGTLTSTSSTGGTSGTTTSGTAGTLTSGASVDSGSTTDTDEGGEACLGDGDCDPERPLCGPGGTCQDGDQGDPCNNESDCGTSTPLCGPEGTCQVGGEGDPCNGTGDCSSGAPICTSNSTCQDGGEGDPCGTNSDCSSETAPFCGPNSTCQDGGEGDACDGPADCSAASAPICSSAHTCQDGSDGDACGEASDCAGDLLCFTNATCSSCPSVVDVDVVADISHTWAGDLVVKLESAEGSLATLVSVAGYDEGADNGAISPPGSPSSGELDGPITFDDDAATSSELMGSGVETGETICIDGPPCEFYSSGFPETEYNLDTLVGEDPLGDWTLCVGDVLLLYTGLLNNWQLEITCSSGSFMVDSGNVGLLIVDDGYDGTLESMACSTVTVP